MYITISVPQYQLSFACVCAHTHTHMCMQMHGEARVEFLLYYLAFSPRNRVSLTKTEGTKKP